MRLQAAYREMLRIRLVEERLLDLATQGLVAGAVHRIRARKRSRSACWPPGVRWKWVVSFYRCHGHALAAASPLAGVVREVVPALARDPADGRLPPRRRPEHASGEGAGCYAVDRAGRRYLDARSSMWNLTLAWSLEPWGTGQLLMRNSAGRHRVRRGRGASPA